MGTESPARGKAGLGNGWGQKRGVQVDASWGIQRGWVRSLSKDPSL